MGVLSINLRTMEKDSNKKEWRSGSEYPYEPFIQKKTGVYRGIPIFLIFAPKH